MLRKGGVMKRSHPEPLDIHKLHTDCVRTLRRCVLELSRMLDVVTAISSYPVEPQRRTAVLQQRDAEIAAHQAYETACDNLLDALNSR
jgi:hypothetical protein